MTHRSNLKILLGNLRDQISLKFVFMFLVFLFVDFSKKEALVLIYLSIEAKIWETLTVIPVLTAIPLPQYVLGTISPNPTLKNVIAINHIEFNKFA